MTWGELAWLRDRIDQRGTLWLMVQYLIFWCIYWPMLQFVMALFGTGEMSLWVALWEVAVQSLICVLLLPPLMFFVRAVGGRRRWIKHARLTEAGWPLAWNPPPPWFVPQQAPPPPSGTNLGPPIAS